MPNYQGVWSLSTQFQNASGWPTPPTPPANIALYKLGFTNTYNSTVDAIDISTTGNATDFGDTTNNFAYLGACSSSTRALFGVGYNGSASVNTILYTTIAATGTFSDFGDATYADYGTDALSNSTRGLFMGGYNGGTARNNIDYVTIASTGNGTDFGDLSSGRYMPAACSSTTRGIIQGGTTGSAYSSIQASIDYVTIASAGNASDFGDLTTATGAAAGFSSNTRGMRASGWDSSGTPQNTIDYITIASTGNATDFGDVATSRAHTSGTSNSTRGLIISGGTGSGGNTVNNTISYVTIASTGNDADFGDVTAGARAGAATSGGHGGLS